MSLRLKLFNALCRSVMRPILRRTKEPSAARRDLEMSCRFFLRSAPHQMHEVALGGVQALELTPPGQTSEGTIFYLHGGGYVAGSMRTHRPMMARFAALVRRKVYLPDYRLAPEYPAPAAFDDALAAWRAIPGDGPVILGGDSAGGGLALAVLARLLADKDPRIAGTFVFSPWTDLALTGPSLDQNAGSDVLLPVERIRELVGMVLGETDPRDPRISPLYAEFSGAPPVYIQASETEILRDDARRMVRLLQAQGVESRIDTWPDAPHVWQMLDGWLPEARVAMEKVADFVEDCLSRPRPESEN